MDIAKILDEAIRDEEMKQDSTLKNGYKVDEKTVYYGYIENECWDKFVSKMKKDNPMAYERYGNGGGKELEVRNVKKDTFPPKMASFGSSSRMIFNLSKENEKNGFLFEEKLSTTIGGEANLDGFWSRKDCNIYIEAKCREPYGTKNEEVSMKYEKLYQAISNSSDTDLSCQVTRKKKKQKDKEIEVLSVKFFYGGKQIQYFDMKQMICHLLGIGTSALKGENGDKDIEFWYLLYNPSELNIQDVNAKRLIMERHEDVCKCAEIDFVNLFKVVLEYLQKEENLGEGLDITEIASRFTFHWYDQKSYKRRM